VRRKKREKGWDAEEMEGVVDEPNKSLLKCSKPREGAFAVGSAMDGLWPTRWISAPTVLSFAIRPVLSRDFMSLFPDFKNSVEETY
jgi:hypothetical protein